MSRYTNKWVEFLNGSNTIRIGGEKDFKSFNSLCKKVGLDSGFSDYYDLFHIAQINHCTIGLSVLVEYQQGKGFSIGYKSFEQSEKWFGQKPYNMTEVLHSVVGGVIDD